MKKAQLHELLYQTLEHERGGVMVFETAVECAVDEELAKEFSKYLAETKQHVEVVEHLFADLELDTEVETPGRKIVRNTGASLVKAMKDAMAAGDPEAAELVACECVFLAETKDHLHWSLLSECAKKATGAEGKALQAAVDEVEDEEDEHLYHSKGWCRELWIKSLGMKAVLPPPEERKHVKTAISAARAQHGRDEMT